MTLAEETLAWLREGDMENDPHALPEPRGDGWYTACNYGDGSVLKWDDDVRCWLASTLAADSD